MQSVPGAHQPPSPPVLARQEVKFPVRCEASSLTHPPWPWLPWSLGAPCPAWCSRPLLGLSCPPCTPDHPASSTSAPQDLGGPQGSGRLYVGSASNLGRPRPRFYQESHQHTLPALMLPSRQGALSSHTSCAPDTGAWPGPGFPPLLSLPQAQRAGGRVVCGQTGMWVSR